MDSSDPILRPPRCESACKCLVCRLCPLLKAPSHGTRPVYLPVSRAARLWQTREMKLFWVSIIAFLGFLATDALSGQYPRDFSGDAMQRHESRLPSSPMLRFPAILGLSYWPFINYPPAPSMPVFNIVVELPDETNQPAPTRPPASAKFWIARCGTFVEIDATKADLIQEENRTDCGR